MLFHGRPPFLLKAELIVNLSDCFCMISRKIKILSIYYLSNGYSTLCLSYLE